MPTARTLFFVALLTMIAACSRLPDMKTLDPAKDRDMIATCESPFIKTPYRFIHAIEATLPGGRSATLMGVTMADPVTRILHSVLMTMEGLVLFDGEYDNGKLAVNRALAPFDKEPVARAMMEDIHLLFLSPQDPIIAAVIRQDGSILCRRRANRRETMDILIRPDRTWKIETYINPFERLREVNASDISKGIPEELVLKSQINGNYTLRMKLIDAEPVSQEKAATSPEFGNP
ncbi:MAG: hypothetical protein JW902_01015 [Syntrophaceae bacterium]|nr:hypothetical protein [Syntrophaceae bacterium]